MDERRVLDRYPLPIARAYRRHLNAAEARERHDHAYYLFEVYLKYAASIAIACYVAGEGRDHRVNAALKGLARPSLGEWLRFLRECLRFLAARDGADPAVQAMARLLDGKEARWGEARKLYNALRAFRLQGPSEKVEVSLEMLLSEVVAYRNRVLGHGAPLERELYERFAGLFAAAFGEVLDASPYLTALRLVSFDAIRVQDGSRVECDVIEFMGDAPVRRKSPLAVHYGERVPAGKALHLLREDGTFISMDPLLLAHREDVYFLNEAADPLRGAEMGVSPSPDYLSYTTGEHHRPQGMDGAQEHLFERILGYRVDGARLSRMGDDVAPAAAPAPDGEKRLGDYRIVREVGRGGMGTVFEAVQESLGRRVALKVLPGTFALDPKRVERFRREARATARIHHASIVPVYEVGEAEGTHYYAMEFIDGLPLDRLLEKAREDSRARPGRKASSTADPAYITHAVEQIASVAEGIEEAHRLGLVHRDVKPSNLLVDASGRYVLADFGLVHEEAAATLTRSGELVGTLGYMPPEQVSRGAVDGRADVYSLGATLYEALTLKPLFERPSEHETQRAILFEEPVPPRRVNPRLHRDLETIILHALEKNPERRYPSAAALAADLKRFLRYEPIQVRPISGLTRILRRAWRHRGKVAAAAAIAVLLLATAFFIERSRRLEHERTAADYEPRVLREVLRMELGPLASRAAAAAGGAGRADSSGVPTRGDMGVLAAGAGPDPLVEAARGLAEAAASLPERPDAHYHRARALVSYACEEEALVEIARALESAPGFVPAVILKAAILEKRGDLAAARAERDRARGLGAGGWAEPWLAAFQAKEDGLWKEAAEAYGKLIDLESGGQAPYIGSSVESRLGRGTARLEAGDHDGALEDFIAARAFWPDAIEPALLQGKAYYLSGKASKAEETFAGLHEKARRPDEAALAIASIYDGVEDHEKGLAWVMKVGADPLRERGRVPFLGRLGRWDEATDAGKRACALFPQDARAHWQLGWVHYMLGRRREAEDLYRKAIALDGKDPIPLTHLGNLLEEDYKRDAAADLYRQAIRLGSRDPWPRRSLASCLEGQGKLEEAAGEYRGAIDLAPHDGGAQGGLSSVLSQLGTLDVEVERRRKAVEARGNDPFAWYLLGIALYWAEDNAAEEAFLKTIALKPRFADAYEYLADTLFREQEYEKARAAYLESVKLSPGRNLRFALGRMFHTQGKLSEAADEYRATIRLSPNWGEAHEELGKVLNSQGNVSAAIDEFCRAIRIYPWGGDHSHWNLSSSLQKGEVKAENAAELDLALERLEEAAGREAVERTQVLRTLALGWNHHPTRRDPEKALRFARLAVEKGGGKDSEAYAILAEVHALRGERVEAVLALEEGMRLPRANRILKEKADERRRALLPDLASYESIDAALEAGDFEGLVSPGAVWRYFIGREEPSAGLEWTGSGFNDKAWPQGQSGFGFADGDDATDLSEMKGAFTTVYIRHPFEVADPAAIEQILLTVRVDDGLVAYVNGREVGRSLAGAPGERIPFDGEATLALTDAEEREVGVNPRLLEKGVNLLAVQGLNASKGSSDLSLIPSLKAKHKPDPSKDQAILEAFRAAAKGGGAGDRIAYLEGRALERAGRHREAAQVLAEVAGRDPGHIEPLLALARCLRLAGDPATAAARLREALQAGRVGGRAAWDLWLSISFLDLKRTPAEALAELSLSPQGSAGGGYTDDLRWLLERLKEDQGIRIDCGGEDRPVQGVAWGRDRFGDGGYATGERLGPATSTFEEISPLPPLRGDVAGTEEDDLYREARMFPSFQLRVPGYRIPLPRGAYRVVLRFVETAERNRGSRVFDIVIEGKMEIEGHDTFAEVGARAADAHAFEDIEVEDGVLDIELLPRAGHPVIAAIEVAPRRAE